MLLEISEGRRVKPPLEIYRPGDLLPYTLRGITWKYALLLGQGEHPLVFFTGEDTFNIAQQQAPSLLSGSSACGCPSATSTLHSEAGVLYL